MHNKLQEAVKNLINEGWSELQDAENVLPMREWGASLLESMVILFGEGTVIQTLNELYKETFPNEKDSDDSDDF